jgi:hypothetical protein
MKEQKEIEEILTIAFNEGIDKALKIVKEKHDPYFLDEFHDRLIEEINKKK